MAKSADWQVSLTLNKIKFTALVDNATLGFALLAAQGVPEAETSVDRINNIRANGVSHGVAKRGRKKYHTKTGTTIKAVVLEALKASPLRVKQIRKIVQDKGYKDIGGNLQALYKAKLVDRRKTKNGTVLWSRKAF